MTTLGLRDHVALAPDEFARLQREVSGHHGLDDIFAWGRTQSPAVHPAEVIKQDEFTHDILVPIPKGRWLVYGTT